MAQIDTVIVDLQVSNREAVAKIEEATEALDKLKDEEAALREQHKNNLITQEAYVKQLTEIKEKTEDARQSKQQYTKALRENVKEQKLEADSLNGLRMQLKGLIQSYDNMSKAEREGAKGKELVQHIQQVTEELSKAEQETGRFQRNVGNYESAIKNLPGKLNEWAVELNNVAKNGGQMSMTFGLMKNGASAFGQTLKLLAKNPFFVILRVVIGLFTLLQSQIKKNDDAMTALQSVTAALKPVMDALRAVMAGLVKVVTGVANALTGALGKLGQWLGLSKESIDANQDLVKSMDALEQKEREYTVGSAKRNAEISELRAKSADREKYSTQERLAFVDEAMKLEKEDLTARRQIAREKLRLAQLEAQQNKDNSDETQNRLAELEAAMYQAEQAYNDGMRTLQRQRTTFAKEEAAAAQAARKERAERAKAAAQRAKTRRDNELKERRAAEDAALALVMESVDKEKQLIDLNAARQIEDLQKQLKEERDLTVKARRAIEQQITLIRAKAAKEREAVDKRVAAERAQRQLEYERRLAEQGAEQTRQYYDAQALAEKNAYNRRLQAARGNAEELAWITQLEAEKELLTAKNKQASILRINYKTEEAYKLALEQATSEVIAAQNKATEAAKATTDAVQQTIDETAEAQRSLASTFGNIAENFGTLFETLASEDARYQDYATAMGYLQLLTSTAVSIASAIEGATKAAAATGPAAPFTLAAYIGEMVATVTAAIAQARSLMQKSKNKPTYATGGVVHGAGTGTSDSVTAQVSNGESILTAKATAMFYDQLSAMNVAGGGKPFDKRRGGNRFATGGVVSTSALMQGRQAQQMADAMRDALADLQPVVSVREITSAQNKVRIKEIISKS